MHSFHQYLKERLQENLPGREAHEGMAPAPKKGRNSVRNYAPEHEDFRNSSVLVLFACWNTPPEIVFTLRAKSIKHGGQISFPGGGREGHETIVETALREAQEEIGLKTGSVEIAGTLSPLYVGHSDNMVTPVVGFLYEQQKFTPNPNEVDEVFTVEIDKLARHEHKENEEWDLKGMTYHVPYWAVHRVPLWGATAMMLNELMELYREYKESTASAG